MHGNYEVWKSIHNSCEEESRTYVGYVNKSHVQNLNHGKLDTWGHHHGNCP